MRAKPEKLYILIGIFAKFHIVDCYFIQENVN